MARLIDADNLIEKLEVLADSYFDINCSDFTIGVRNLCRQQGVDASIEVVKKQEPIDAVKHGRWIFIEQLSGGYYSYKCSECQHLENVKKRQMLGNYCSYCGTKMDGEVEC